MQLHSVYAHNFHQIMRHFIVFLASYGASSSEAFSTFQLCNTKFRFVEPVKVYHDGEHDISKKGRCTRCPETIREDSDLDRKEALFAMLGTLWATTSSLGTQFAYTVYESDAQIEFPKIMEGMSQRVNQQCLVETLGNQECLVNMDSAGKRYQEAESEILL